MREVAEKVGISLAMGLYCLILRLGWRGEIAIMDPVRIENIMVADIRGVSAVH